MDRPLSESLQKLRRAQRALVRRKRGSRVRVSFSHVSTSRPVAVAAAAAATTNLAKLESPEVEKPWKDLRKDALNGGRPSLQKQGLPPPLPTARAGEPLDEYHAFIRDGQRLSSPSRQKRAVDGRNRSEQDDRFSLMQVVDRTTGKTGGRSSRGRRPEYAHAAPLEYHPIEKGPRENGRHAIVMPRPSINRRTSPSRQHRPQPTAHGSTAPKPIPTMTPTARTGNGRRYALTDPVVMESIRRSLSQQHRLSSLAPSEGKLNSPRSPKVQPPSLAPETLESSTPSSNVNGASRSSSQQRALTKFTRELEKFAKASGIAGQLPVLTPTVTDTPVSLETIKELLPYRDQFLATGLAVTSTDQKSPSKEDKPQPPEDDGARPSRFNFDGGTTLARASSSESSISASSDTVVRFLPPNNLALALADQIPEKKQKHEMHKIVKSDRTTRSIIPWLRRKSSLKPTRPPSREIPSKARSFPVLSVDKPLPQRPVPARPPPRPPAGEVRTERMILLEEKKRLPPLPRICQGSGTLRGTPQHASQPSQAKILKMPTMVQEEFEAPPAYPSTREDHDPPERDKENDKADATTRPSSNTSPLLPETWKDEGDSPSSFERALDDVVRKLDELEESRLASEAARTEKTIATRRETLRRSSKMPASPAERLQRASHLRRMKMEGAQSQSSKAAIGTTPAATSGGNGVNVTSSGSKSASSETSKALSVVPRQSIGACEKAASDLSASSLNARDVTVDYQDRDISDRDILKGLRLAISAACDEDLDTWIRAKTGLRLRRFLADLKTFEKLQEQWPHGKTGAEMA